jgi:hypothetical protein
MHFLVVDVRFGTPIYVLLESDPNATEGYPGLSVRVVSLEPGEIVPGPKAASHRSSLGRDPNHLERFREFSSDGAVTRAGFILVEPRYVGATWEGYCRHYRPEGEKPTKRLNRPGSTAPPVAASTAASD